jgi:tetratricopeptide (TPR) repeat protein
MNVTGEICAEKCGIHVRGECVALRQRVQDTSLSLEDRDKLAHLLERVWDIQNHGGFSIHARFEVLRLFALLPATKFQVMADEIKAYNAQTASAFDSNQWLLTMIYRDLEAELQLAIVFCSMLPEETLFDHRYFADSKQGLEWWKECMIAYLSLNDFEVDPLITGAAALSRFNHQDLGKQTIFHRSLDFILDKERRVPASTILQKLEYRGFLVRIRDGYTVANQVRIFCRNLAKEYQKQKNFITISRARKLKIVEYVKETLQGSRARSLEDCIQQFRLHSHTWSWALKFLSDELSMSDQVDDSPSRESLLSSYVDLLWAVRRSLHHDVFDSEIAEEQPEKSSWTAMVSQLKIFVENFTSSKRQSHIEWFHVLRAKLSLMRAMSNFDRNKVETFELSRQLCEDALKDLSRSTVDSKESKGEDGDDQKTLLSEILMLQGSIMSYLCHGCTSAINTSGTEAAEQKWNDVGELLQSISASGRTSEHDLLQCRRLYCTGNLHLYTRKGQGRKLERLEMAENCYKKAIEIDKSQPVLPSLKANLYHNLGECQLKRAKKWLENKTSGNKGAAAVKKLNVDEILCCLEEARGNLHQAILVKEQFADSKNFLSIKRLCQSHRTLADVEALISLVMNRPIGSGENEQEESTGVMRRLVRAARSSSELHEALTEVSAWGGAICFPLTRPIRYPAYMKRDTLIARIQQLALGTKMESVNQQLDSLAELFRTWVDLKLAILGPRFKSPQQTAETGTDDPDFRNALNLLMQMCPVCNILAELASWSCKSSRRESQGSISQYVQAIHAVHKLVRFPGESKVRDQQWQKLATENLRFLLREWYKIRTDDTRGPWFIAEGQLIINSLIFVNSKFTCLEKLQILIMCIHSEPIAKSTGDFRFIRISVIPDQCRRLIGQPFKGVDPDEYINLKQLVLLWHSVLVCEHLLIQSCPFLLQSLFVYSEQLSFGG